MGNSKFKKIATAGKTVNFRNSEISANNSLFSYDDLFSHTKIGVYRNTSGPKGHFLQANSAIVRMFEAKSKKEFLKHNVSDLYQIPSDRAILSGKILKNGFIESEELALRTLKGKNITGSVTAVMKKDKNGDIYFDGIIEDITERKKSERKIQRLTNLYRALSECNQSIMRSKSEEELFQKICQDVVRFGGMRMAWIGLIEPKTKLINDVASFGIGTEYLRNIKISTDADKPSGRGPTGTAVREKRPYWCQDFQSDPNTAPWYKSGLSFGWKSSAALPIYRGGYIVAVLSLYSEEVNAFDDAARNLLIEVASDVSYALDNLSLETKRALAENNLKASEERYKKLIETEPECVKLVSKDNNLLDMNSAGLAMIEADSLEQVAGKSLLEIIDPEYREAFADVTRKVFSGKEASAQFKIIGLKGGKRWLETHAVPLKDERGKIYSLLAVTRDITAQKKSEEALSGRVDELEKLKKSLMNLVEELEEKEQEVELEKVKYATLLENMSDGLIAVDLSGKVTYANDEAVKLLGKNEKKIAGPEVADYFKLSELKDFDTKIAIPRSELPINKVLKGEIGKIRRKYYIVRKDNKEFPAIIAVSPIIVDGKLTGANAIFRDITQEAEVDRVKNEFISVASHQLRTPLSSIKWLIEALLSDENLNEKVVAKLKNVFISNERLIALVNDLLRITKMESGNFSGERKLFDMADSLRRIVSDYEPMAAKTGKKIVLIMPEEVKKIFGYQILFEEGLNNIISNAITYGKENSVVAVKVEPINGEYRILVNNKDHFISKEDGDKIFTKFFRAQSAKLIKPEGSGLGLYIAKFGVEKNGGKIWFESDAKNGTTFYFTLPASSN